MNRLTYYQKPTKPRKTSKTVKAKHGARPVKTAKTVKAKGAR